jgi:acyl-CoA dehydrogenase
MLHGSAMQFNSEVVPPVLRGEKIAALAITEPGGGSDVAAAAHHCAGTQTATITSSMAKRPSSPPACAPTGSRWPCAPIRSFMRRQRHLDAAGAGRCCLASAARASSKMGWLCSDTAQLHFDNVRVPARYLLGQRRWGLSHHHEQLQRRTHRACCRALGFAQACLDEALAWARSARPSAHRSLGIRRFVTSWWTCRCASASTEAWLESAVRSKAMRFKRPGPSDVGRVGCAGLHAEEPRHADHAVLRRCRRCRFWAAWASCAAR